VGEEVKSPFLKPSIPPDPDNRCTFFGGGGPNPIITTGDGRPPPDGREDGGDEEVMWSCACACAESVNEFALRKSGEL
jgi:hypothetical protein